MNAGLSNLTLLKLRLLPESLRTRDDWNNAILQLGLGVASHFERHCNRLFGRVAGATDILQANADHWFTRRYPIESITKWELRTDFSTGWVEQPLANIGSVNEEVGRVDWGGALGDATGQIRLTYTGGYWWDDDEGNTGIMPATATALPESLREAWMLCVETIWGGRDKIGSNIARVGSGNTVVSESLAALEFSPMIRSMLAPYIRYQMLA